MAVPLGSLAAMPYPGQTISPEEAHRRLYNEQMSAKMQDAYGHQAMGVLGQGGYECGWKDPRDQQKEECLKAQMEMLDKKPLKGKELVDDFHKRRRTAIILLEGL